ncbi:MAG TPA: hypothetical protein VJS64_10675 [Pyrinomonadaceae bacterium]|nr:hypothetical protein [Pyrinomonadaceae bacterium]
MPRPALSAIRRYRRVEAQLETKQIKEKIRKACRVLLGNGVISGKRATALRLYVGLDKGGWRTYRQVAKSMDVSYERIRQLLEPSKVALEAELEAKINWRRLAASEKRSAQSGKADHRVAINL